MEHQIRVLVVDDEDRFRENITKILNGSGFEAQSASDGETALNKVDSYEYDVVLLDMKMPGLSGEQTLCKMKDCGAQAEVIVLTGHASVSGALDMMDLGAFDYLLKPADIPEMLKKVRLAGEKKLLREGRIGMSDIYSGN
ncbi:response regulator [Desulfobaculum bizertense]|uniref:Response regulator receiver domain-containing protein n=1 Tax=Desulfobaculum bizertense DSM 18034 TaxID=1121442 RepID=A0A1T4WPJ2_9BACT|nr:response regulator [Desulfobaculum bizertense]UIJ39251.1 response regulator [Desulfobaculum bizertense]SKA79280.1 Response regulator receiver domain-containing protein [Desulfobaculum bizertense DSM 18034]